MNKKSKVMLAIIIILLLLVVLFAIMLGNYRIQYDTLGNVDANNKVGLNNGNTVQSGNNLLFDNTIQNSNNNQNSNEQEDVQSKDLTTIEMTEMKKFLEDKANRNFLAIVSDFKSYEDVSIEDIILFADVLFSNKYTLQGIEEMYEAEGGILAGGEIIKATVSDVQKIYKEKFNVEVTKEDIKNMANNNKNIYYNSENDLLMFIPDGIADQYINEILSGTVQNNKYVITLKIGIVGNDRDYSNQTLTLVKKDGKFYFESLVTENNNTGKRDLTTQELDEIKKMIDGNDDFLWDKSFEEYPKLDVTEMVGNTLGEARKGKIVLDKIKQTYDEIWNIYENNGNLFAAGDVEYCTLNDIMKMYKSVFNKDISKEELLSQIKKETKVNKPILYYEKEEIIIVDLGAGSGQPYNILSSSYENGKYIVNISRSDYVYEHNYDEVKKYTFTGTIVFEKVDDRYCFNSYTYNNDKQYIQ